MAKEGAEPCWPTEPAHGGVRRTDSKGTAGGGAVPYGVARAAEAAIDEYVAHRLDELRRRAEDVVLWWDAANEDERSRRNKGPGVLAVRIRTCTARQATPGLFSIDWYHCWYITTQKRTHFRSAYIARGDGDSYSMRAFAGKVRHWQRPLVAEAEKRLGQIRAEIREVVAVRTAFRAAERRRGRRTQRMARRSE